MPTEMDGPSDSVPAHLDDVVLQPFRQPKFDRVTHLNNVLPALSLSATSHPAKRRDGASLAELTSHTQMTLSQMNAHTARLSENLTTLTDDIIRTGSRLAYEVEMLRGDALALSEALDEGLVNDMRRLLPVEAESSADVDAGQPADPDRAPPVQDVPAESGDGRHDPEEPSPRRIAQHLERLRTLATAKSRLEAVVRVFGDAMEWTLPPSELSTITSSFISVSGPDPASDSRRLEEKGQAAAKRLRDEIGVLLAGSPGQQGVDAARQRVEYLRQLTKVWKGTAEEKARSKFVDSLAKLVAEKERSLGR